LPAKQAKEALDVMDKAVRVLTRWGFSGNACLISANQYTRKHAQVDVLADTGNTHLVAENQASRDYTPSELGLRIGGLSGQKVNLALAAAGLQIKPAKDWIPTDKAEGYTSGTTPAKPTAAARQLSNSNGTTAYCRCLNR